MRDERDILPPGDQHSQQQHHHHHQHNSNHHHHPNKRARFNDGGRYGNDSHHGASSRRWDKNSQFRLRKLGIHVSAVPYGMTRARENKTSWNKRTRTMNWQVEWFVHEHDDGPSNDAAPNRDDDEARESAEATQRRGQRRQPTRILYKILDETPLAHGFEAGLASFRHTQMTDEERAAEKSSKKQQQKEETSAGRAAKTAAPQTQHCGGGQNSSSSAWTAHSATVQSPASSAWQQAAIPASTTTATTKEAAVESNYQFFYHKPRVPSRQTQKLVPLNPADSLAKILPGLEIIEFPAIHVLPKGAPLPEGYSIDEAPKHREMPVRPRQGEQHHRKNENGKRSAGELIGYESSDNDAEEEEEGEEDDGPEEAGVKEAAAVGAGDVDPADTTSSEGSSDDDGDDDSDAESDMDMAEA
ncbi:uncharacterized protein B0I36DRAFT_334125 [Microdochium trichocladiopsis]|uniref:BCD1 alpha/beta domain-containing protein n=1 Tax=Microdochium trichocladiopsis TaxID=1682393 RepID=A0A9P9BKI1_9PEZI|nr:uncharacterized protein B0I36DRAFT_334125 [Microdochium trichocladiopsis]KAH7021254.1 hypothetical protein B0I36DRAFT_334125 [Microdochium trichocladiopsis]